MARFVYAPYPTSHAGIDRVARGFGAIGQAIRNFDGTRGTATLLLAALVSAVIVVANQVIETWTEGHLFAAWILSWLVAFAALALFAQPARRLGAALAEAARRWNEERKQSIEDEKMWRMALTDARIMADLSRAMAAEAADVRRRYY